MLLTKDCRGVGKYYRPRAESAYPQHGGSSSILSYGTSHIFGTAKPTTPGWTIWTKCISSAYKINIGRPQVLSSVKLNCSRVVINYVD